MLERIQLSRQKGWRIPPRTLKVSRGTPLGNPFRIYEHCKGPDGDWGVEDTGRFNLPIVHGYTKQGATLEAIGYYRRAFDEVYPPASTARNILAMFLNEYDYLGCWCRLSDPCHVDVLLELANTPKPQPHTPATQMR